jgi:hypothetical protein
MCSQCLSLPLGSLVRDLGPGTQNNAGFPVKYFYVYLVHLNMWIDQCVPVRSIDMPSHVTHRRLDSSGKKKKKGQKKIMFPPPLWVI